MQQKSLYTERAEILCSQETNKNEQQYTGGDILITQESQRLATLSSKSPKQLSHKNEKLTKINVLVSPQQSTYRPLIFNPSMTIQEISSRKEMKSPHQNKNYLRQTHPVQQIQKSKANVPDMQDFSFWSVVQIRKMMDRLKQQYAYANLTTKHYEIIQDKAAPSHKKERYEYRQHLEEFNCRKSCRKVLRKFQQSYWVKKLNLAVSLLLKKIPVFSPSAVIKQVWDIALCLSLLLLFYCVPLHIAVQQPITYILRASALWVALTITTLDIFISLNTGYFQKGHIVNERSLIFERYKKNQLVVDLLSLIPIYIVLSFSDSFSFGGSFVTLLFFLKVRDLSRIIKKIEESFLLTPTSTNLVALLKLLSVILFIAHLCACLWLFEAYLHPDVQTWLSNDKLETSNWNPSWLDSYLKAYYFSTVTMVTVGYGDIYPANNQERLLSVATMLLACCIFAYMQSFWGSYIYSH